MTCLGRTHALVLLAALTCATGGKIRIVQPSAEGQYFADEGIGRGQVDIALDVEVEGALEEHTVCVTFDWNDASCLQLENVATGSFRLSGVLLGLRRLRATLSLVTSPLEVLSAHEVEFTMRGGASSIDLTALRSVGASGPSPWRLATPPAAEGGVEGDGAGLVSVTPLRAAFFDEIYESRFWVSSGDASSGPGSDVGVTGPAREALAEVLAVFRVQTMLDIPCGDATWVEHTAFPAGFIEGDRYLGADVSPAIVARNRARFVASPPGNSSSPPGSGGGGGGWRFVVADAVEGPELPGLRIHGLPPELILTRHMMYHLPPSDNLEVLRRLEASGAKYLLLTTHLRADENEAPFALARGHAVNLFRAPYCLRDPLRLFPDNGPDLFLGLWALKAAFPEAQRDAVPPLRDPGRCL